MSLANAMIVAFGPWPRLCCGAHEQPSVAMSKTSRVAWYSLLTIGALFTIAGAGMIITGADHGWPAFLFFGTCTAVFISELWPGLASGRSTPPSDLLHRFPGPVELAAGRRKFAFLAVASAIFGGVSLWFLQHETLGWFAAMIIWVGVIACVAAVPLMIMLIFLGSRLRLDAKGLTITHAWRSQFTRWADSSVFEVATLPIPEASQATTLIVYDDATNRSTTLAGINARMTGRGSALPDTYGLSHDELAWLLNRWREQALARHKSS